MRWSKMHIPTLRDDPADAGAPSHRLLLRAGYIRQLMAGHYSLLPLGQRVRLKVIGIIREEMNAIGAQEILMPVMHPAELWQQERPLGADGRGDVPAQGPQGRRPGPRHDPRGDRRHPRHRARVLPPAAADVVPVPDQAARRAAAQGGPDAHPRVHHEGLLQLRPRAGRARRVLQRPPRRLRPHVRAARHPGHPGRGVQRHHGRLGLHRVRLPLADRRGPHHLLPELPLRGQHRKGHVPAARDRRFSRTDHGTCRPRALCHPGCAHHRRISPSSTRLRPTGRSRPWCTSWTARSPWC